jgi:hypothetical protein
MQPLADAQALFRSALVGGNGSAVYPVLSGVPDVSQRLAIYQRHHRHSLVRHIAGRFPTLAWLLGSKSMLALAEAFALAHRPTAPCMAEYGEAFPAFVAASEPGRARPYLAAAAELDWCLGETAVAVDLPALGIDVLSTIATDRLPETKFGMQPGARYVKADCPVDELVRLRLSEHVPDSFRLDRRPVFLEVTGARGTFHIGRLDRPIYEFRARLAVGETIAAAADAAFAADIEFEAGIALAGLFADRLVTTLITPAVGA